MGVGGGGGWGRWENSRGNNKHILRKGGGIGHSEGENKGSWKSMLSGGQNMQNKLNDSENKVKYLRLKSNFRKVLGTDIMLSEFKQREW